MTGTTAFIPPAFVCAFCGKPLGDHPIVIFPWRKDLRLKAGWHGECSDLEPELQKDGPIDWCAIEARGPGRLVEES